MLALVGNWPFNNRSDYFIAHDYVENIQGTIEPNGLLLTLDWQVASPMLYTREVENRRPDIKAIDVSLLRRSWYFDYLRRVYPDMIARSRNEVDRLSRAAQTMGKGSQGIRQKPSVNVADQSGLQRIVARSWSCGELKVGPVYVTEEVFVLRESGEREFTQWLNQNFQGIPTGLVFQLFRDREFHDPGELHLQMRGLTNETKRRFEDDDVVKLKVIPAYRLDAEKPRLVSGSFQSTGTRGCCAGPSGAVVEVGFLASSDSTFATVSCATLHAKF